MWCVHIGHCNGEMSCVNCYYSGSNRVPIANTNDNNEIDNSSNSSNSNANNTVTTTDINVSTSANSNSSSSNPNIVWQFLENVCTTVTETVIPLTTNAHVMTSYMQDVKNGVYKPL